MLRVAVVASFLGTVASYPVMPDNGRCDQSYDCKWTYVDNSGTTYDFDFSHHCSPYGYHAVDASNHTYWFNICGQTPQLCLPQTYTTPYRYGVAVQTFGAPPPCNPNDPSTQFYDPVLNKTFCYTSNCEVLGVGTPMWGLMSPTNPATGGVLLQHTGVAGTTSDGNKCPVDPSTGDQKKRSVTMLLNCNATLAPGVLNVLGAFEDSQCQYIIEMQTAAACGCAPQCGQNKICGPDGCGGYCSGPSLSGWCPQGQNCMADQTCCRPDCTNRDCGSDGCGGTCGTCGDSEVCSGAQVCLSSVPLVPQAPVVYGTDSGGLAGSFFGGVATSLACAGALWFFRFGGRASFDRWRFGARAGEEAEAGSKLIGGGATSRGAVAAGAAGTGVGAAASAASPGASSSKFTSYGGYGTTSS